MHVATFEKLVHEIDSNLRVRHVVAEELLADAQKTGAKDPGVVQRIQCAMIEASDTGAAVVVCTCSTIGGAAERTPTGGDFVAARIDRAMADRAVALGPDVLILAALESTLGPTTELIHESAQALQTQVNLQHRLVPGAWAHFLRGDREAYLRMVAEAVLAAGTSTNVIVLAQASMAPAASFLGWLGVEILSSPVSGVQRAVAQLRAK